MENHLPEIMTIEEVAEYLRVPVSSLYKLAQQGKIPASKVGRHWRFRREFIDR
ncbi:MAG TPA: helix-turn-helix domain-containing protein [Bellilinea sp.]|nr:helix-turn-helix domain-containing protein [Bellilinea sp.]